MIANLDFCLGGTLCALTFRLFGEQATWYQVIIGGLLALVPDLDVFLIKTKKYQHYYHHYSPFHYPLLMLPIGFVASCLIMGLIWGTVTFVALLAHLIHDICAKLGGVVIFWPFSNKLINICGAFNPGQAPVDEFMRQHGSDATDHWTKKYWYKPSKTSITEIVLMVTISSLCLISWPQTWPTFLTSSASWLVMCCVWIKRK